MVKEGREAGYRMSGVVWSRRSVAKAVALGVRSRCAPVERWAARDGVGRTGVVVVMSSRLSRMRGCRAAQCVRAFLGFSASSTPMLKLPSASHASLHRSLLYTYDIYDVAYVSCFD